MANMRSFRNTLKSTKRHRTSPRAVPYLPPLQDEAEEYNHKISLQNIFEAKPQDGGDEDTARRLIIRYLLADIDKGRLALRRLRQTSRYFHHTLLFCLEDMFPQKLVLEFPSKNFTELADPEIKTINAVGSHKKNKRPFFARIGKNYKILAIKLHHMAAMSFLPQSHDDGYSNQRLTLHPLPPVAHFAGDAFALHAPQNPKVGSLSYDARNKEVYVNLLYYMPTLTHLIINCLGTPSDTKRTAVDETLLALKAALQTHTTEVIAIKNFEYLGHALGVWCLAPGISVTNKAGKTWWSRVTRVDIRIRPESLTVGAIHKWEKEMVLRGWAHLLVAMAPRLESAMIGVADAAESIGDGKPGQKRGPHASLRSPLEIATEIAGRRGVRWPRLVELWMKDLSTSWLGSYGLREFLNVAARTVVKLVYQRMVFVEGEEGWEALYTEWEIEKLREEDGWIWLRRKETEWEMERVRKGAW